MTSSLELFAPERSRRIYLKPGRDKSVRNRHPWVFDGGVAREEGPADAAIGQLFGPDGRLVASGFYSSRSQIRLRAIAFDQDLTPDILRDRIASAVGQRAALLDADTDAVRLIHSEGDGLSGLVADLYADVLVVEITCAGLEKLRDFVIDALLGCIRESRPVNSVLLKNDLPHRRIEGLSQKDEWVGEGSRIRGFEDSNSDSQTTSSMTAAASNPRILDSPNPRTPDSSNPREVIIREHGLRFVVQPGKGQKTGFFLDQRENRAIARRLARGARVLNVFSYTGGFGVYAAAGGAVSVEEVDVSEPAIALAQRNHELNPFDFDVEGIAVDAFDYLRELRSDGRRFDLVIVDPPAFAKSKGDIDRAARGYKDVNMQALALVEPGGHLMTFSCSGHISPDLYQKIIFSAAVDANCNGAIVARLGAGPDHPVSLFCPEGEYLKGMLVRVN